MDFEKYLTENLGVDGETILLCREAENEVLDIFDAADETAQYNTLKVLRAMQKNKLSDFHFAASTGYGYNDLGREALENIYSDVFGGEISLVRPQIVSGTHALSLALFGNLRCGDELLSPAGNLYDTLNGVIGVKKTKNSLMENGVSYRQVDLTDDFSFNYPEIEKAITPKTKLAAIQRSRGYDWRPSFSTAQIKELIAFIKGVSPNVICMVDNCYGEFVGATEPGFLGADLCVGSLIKNPGGGIALTGGYITGREEYVNNAADRLTAPGIGREIGPGLGVIPSMLQGLFTAPGVVAGCVKSAVFAARIFEKLGLEVMPLSREKRSDIVQSIKFNSPDMLIAFCSGIQSASPVDSHVSVRPAPMPGYAHDVIMAAGAFVQGASVELSADAPMREPYIAYLQGGLNWYHAKTGIILSVNKLMPFIKRKC